MEVLVFLVLLPLTVALWFKHRSLESSYEAAAFGCRILAASSTPFEGPFTNAFAPSRKTHGGLTSSFSAARPDLNQAGPAAAPQSK
jgi:hypothetical protein